MSTEHVLLQDIQPPAGAPSPSSAEIIDSQIHVEPSNATIASIYRFATVSQRCVLLVAALCAVIAGAAMPLVTVVFGALVDEFIGALQHGQDTSDDISAKVQHLTLFLVYIAIGSFVTTLVSTWGFNLVGEQITADLQQRLLVSVLQQNIAYFDVVGTGQLTSQIDSDMKLIQEGVSQKVAFIISGVSGFVVALVIAFVRNRHFAGIMFSQPVALLLLVGVLGSWLSRTHQKAVDQYAMADNLAQEVFSAMRTVISYRSQRRYARKYHDSLKVPASLDFQERLIFGIVVAGSFTVLHWANGLGIWQAEHLIHKGRCTLPEALTIIYATTVAGGMLCQALPFLVSISQAAGAARRIFSVIERVSPISPVHSAGMTPSPVQGRIRFEDVNFAYPSQPERTILNCISFEVPAGHTVALVGPSGSGKSTVFSLLERLYLPLSGRITLDDEPIEDLDVSWLRSQIGYVDQGVRLFHGSIHANIAYGLHGSATEDQDASWIRHQVIQAAETAQIHPFIVGLSHGYDTIIGVNGLGLSGGQRQQLAVARAIVSKPAILLLDEATSALDSQSEKEVQETLSRAMVGRSTIVIAHRLSTVRDADRTIVLQDGRVVNQGSHKQLLSDSAMYQELVRQQTLRSRDRFDGDQKPDEKLSARNPKDPVEKISIEPVSANILENPSSSSTYRNSVWLVWSLNKPEVYYIVAGIIFSILAGITYPIQAIFFGNGIISIINPQLSTAGQTVHFWALAYLIHGIVVFAIYCIRGYCFAVSASELSLRARSSLFKCLVLKNLPFFETQNHLVGTLVSFLTSGTQRIIGISGTSLGLVAEGTIMLSTGIVVACVFGWKLGLAAMAVIPLIAISGFLQYYIVAQVQKRIKHQANAVAVAHEAFSAIRAVTIFNLQTTISEAFTRARDRDNQGGYWVLAAAMYACMTTLRILSIAFVFWFGGVHLIATGEYDIQQFFVCFAATVWGTQSASALFAHAPDIAGAHAAAQQLQEYMQDSTMEQLPKKNTNPNNDNRSVSAVTYDMTMERVRFGYPTHPFQLTLDDVSLDIPAGTFVALVGATGSGKSSAINLLSRFYSPESGNITLGGTPIHEYDLDDYYGCLALVDQNPCLIGQDLRECLQGDDRVVSDDDILEALTSVGLACFVASLPQGLNTPVSANGSTLSGGQRQRMAVAKALLWKPKILLLDEATSSLDIATEQLVQDALQTAMNGRTIIAIAHRLKTIVKADKIHVFDHGRIIETGTHDELMEKRGKYWTMAMLQHI